ncbi:MAG: nucleotidyltransferase domain-containing protein [Chloroflexi bacterium]|nr:nucleotidyltransferase domain-containing protein [Chloroflexota bacterium]
MKIFWLDREATVAAVRAAAQTMGQAHPEVEEIRLFGSLAQGRAVPGSDADLLVVLECSDQAFHERILAYLPRGWGIGVDVFPYTREELGEFSVHSPRFYRAVMEESLVLYRRQIPMAPAYRDP